MIPLCELHRAAIQCSLPAALDAVGERWTFMILRAAFNGITHFDQFQEMLGIARNILSNRLARLVDRGILQRIPAEDDRRKVVYRLTAKGEALLPALIALRQWGERWEADTPNNPVLVDRRDGLPVTQVRLQAADGRPLELADLGWADRAEIESRLSASES